MKSINPEYHPLTGQTYSLFGNNLTTDNYYSFIDNLADYFLNTFLPDEISLLLRKGKNIKEYIKKFFLKYSTETGNSFNNGFEEYTQNVKSHLEKLSLIRKFDNTIGLSEAHYHFYMLEAEIINRINKNNFLACKYKIALLPHCLRDTNKDCRAVNDDIDLTCRHCTSDCFINYASVLLKNKNIVPYIWINLNQKKIFSEKIEEFGSVGVLGIACIPELVNGMRKCIKYRVPVVGVPLNANRCRRWMGEYYKNSFTIERLQKLLTNNMEKS